MSQNANAKLARVFHVLDFPDKTRATLEVIEAPHAFFVTIRFPVPKQPRPELAALAKKWVGEGLAHTINDPRPNFEKMYVGDRLVYSGMAKNDFFCGYVYPDEKGEISQ